MASIDIGMAAIDRTGSASDGFTRIALGNPANVGGSLDTVEIYLGVGGANVKVGTFYGGTATKTNRDYETIGTVTGYSKQTFSGLSIGVEADDCIGFYGTAGEMKFSDYGSGLLQKSGDQFDAGEQAYTLTGSQEMSLYASGSTVAPTVTTQAVSDIAYSSGTGNGNIISIGGETVTRRGFCYMVGVAGDPTTANSVAYDDGSFGTGAYTKAITGLTPEESYRVRAYAINPVGTSYGSTVQMLTKVAAPTDVAATDGAHTDKVTVTWTKSTGATGYQIYRDGTPLGWLGDVATGDDSGADAPVITPGTAVATDGESSAHVALSLSGESVASGTTHSYVVRAKTATDESADSSADNGYIGVGALTYQWQRSAADSDANYSNINGATTEAYNDTEAPVNGDGRYFKCVLDATGAAQQTSTPDRGYIAVAPSVTTQAVADITDTNATLNGNITDEGTKDVTRRGFCYFEGTSGDPDTTDSTSYDDGSFDTGAYTKAITVLSAGTYYRVRAYAVNLEGTGYGTTVQMLTTGSATVEIILEHATLLQGAETALTDCDEHIDLSRVARISFFVEMTFEAAVSADPTISIFASPENDDDEYDTSAWKTWTFPRSAGNTISLHWPYTDEIRPLPKYIKTKVKNNSGAGANTSITSITIKKVILGL